MSEPVHLLNGDWLARFHMRVRLGETFTAEEMEAVLEELSLYNDDCHCDVGCQCSCGNCGCCS